MCTEVKHGPTPHFSGPTFGTFGCTVEGHYSHTHDLVYGGVTGFRWNSTKPEKQMAELLGMRTAFLDWFLETYQVLGGSRDEAIGQVEFIAQAWRDGKTCVVTETGWELQ